MSISRKLKLHSLLNVPNKIQFRFRSGSSTIRARRKKSTSKTIKWETCMLQHLRRACSCHTSGKSTLRIIDSMKRAVSIQLKDLTSMFRKQIYQIIRQALFPLITLVARLKLQVNNLIFELSSLTMREQWTHKYAFLLTA